MDCPGHPDTIIGTVTHSECPRQCIEDGYPPLPGDPDWPAEAPADENPPDEIPSNPPE
jgi:hypothetical protein